MDDDDGMLCDTSTSSITLQHKDVIRFVPSPHHSSCWLLRLSKVFLLLPLALLLLHGGVVVVVVNESSYLVLLNGKVVDRIMMSYKPSSSGRMIILQQ